MCPRSAVWLLSLSATATVPAYSQAPVSSPDTVIAITHVTVIPMDRERRLPDQTVVVRGDRIVALGPASKVPVPAGARQIDGRRRFLAPGLADMHVHLRGFFGQGAADSTAVSDFLFGLVANGITTIRDMHSGGGAPDNAALGTWTLALRARLARGEVLGPRLYTAGDPDYSSPEAAARSIVKLKADGHDFVKVYNDPHPAEVFDSIAASANRVGLRMTGHVPPEKGLEWALKNYVSIEHLYGYVQYVLGLDYGRAGWDRYVMDRTAPWQRPGYTLDSAKVRAVALATKRAHVWNSQCVYDVGEPTGDIFMALHDAGAGILSGSDLASDPEGLFLQNYTVIRILEQMVEAGFTPYEALATSTRNVAEFLGTRDSTGTIAVGKRADLLLLRADPLRDISHLRSRVGVMVGGRWLGEDELDERVGRIKHKLWRAWAEQLLKHP